MKNVGTGKSVQSLHEMATKLHEHIERLKGEFGGKKLQHLLHRLQRLYENTETHLLKRYWRPINQHSLQQLLMVLKNEEMTLRNGDDDDTDDDNDNDTTMKTITKTKTSSKTSKTNRDDADDAAVVVAAVPSSLTYSIPKYDPEPSSLHRVNRLSSVESNGGAPQYAEDKNVNHRHRRSSSNSSSSSTLSSSSEDFFWDCQNGENYDANHDNVATLSAPFHRRPKDSLKKQSTGDGRVLIDALELSAASSSSRKLIKPSFPASHQFHGQRYDDSNGGDEDHLSAHRH